MRLSKVQKKLTDMNIPHRFKETTMRGSDIKSGDIIFSDTENNDYIIVERIVGPDLSIQKILASGLFFEGDDLTEEEIIDWLDRNTFRFVEK